MKKIYNVVSIIIIALLIVALILFGVPRLFGIRTFSVQSESMSPQYNVGDLLYVRPVEPEDLKVGDAITFVINEEGQVATHRIVAIDEENNMVYTKGDANEFMDENPVLFENIVGRVQFDLPHFGNILHLITEAKTTVLLIIAGIPIVMFLLGRIRSR